LEPLLVIKSVLALRTQKTISSIPNSASIKDLCAGNSAMQNELVGDLQTEFGGSFADGSESIPIEQFSQQISNYSTHGKIMKSKISKLVSSKMPVGFGLSNIKDYLKTKGLGDGSIDTVLTFAVTLEPKLRFASEQETYSWIDGVMSQAGITVSVSSNSPSASYAIQAQNPVIMGAFTQNFETLLKAQIDAISQYLGNSFYSHLKDRF
jgi:fatty acid synthase subunit beta